MKSFLEYVAEDIISKYGTNLSRTAVVFPNKRAALFLNEYMARQAGKPLWSPAYITISELFRRQSPLQVADPIKQVCELHKSFCLMTGSTETLDKFYGWGQLLLSDFDDIDKNMADAYRVFANIRDIHELEDVSYLTDDQLLIIQRFFSNFSEDHNSELKERFLHLWSHLADIYHDFNNRLASQGLAYEGALYRQVVQTVTGDNKTLSIPDPDTLATAFPYDNYLFVGFNLLQKVEQQLFAALQKTGKAHFYWDFDHYYMKQHEAGRYISQYLQLFPNELDNNAMDIYSNFKCAKQITYIAAPTENIQARYVSSWLREGKRYKDGRRTAIVLCNEALLPVVIHCLPNEIEKVNVTTGYPLSQTPVASYIQLWFELAQRGRIPRLIRNMQRHPYSKYISEETELIPMPTHNDDSPTVLSSYTTHLASLLRQIAQQGKNDISDPLFQESIFKAYTLVNRLNSLIESGDLTIDVITLQRLTTQLLQQTSIPFHGEPAEGLQIMGVLETRNLDFDHILILSCNEGNLPRGVNDSSFIPHSIRQAYELTTIENKVGIYAYYFHRLLQRAGDITILYNNSTEDGQRGEMSRFMLQLMAESPHSIIRHTLLSGQTAHHWQPSPIEKTTRVVNLMAEKWWSAPQGQSITPLSPSAINHYMRCPLQFYYHYVAEIIEPDVPDDEQELDNRIFGNIFHEAAYLIYKQMPQEIDKRLIDHLLKTKTAIERAVDEAFDKELPFIPNTGLQLINREVIVHYLRQLLEIDRRLAPFTILGLECDVERPLTQQAEHPSPISIGGRIDRLDLLDDSIIRVVDYKTGSRRLKPLNDVEAIFEPENIHEHSDYYLQTFIYADIVSRQKDTSSLTSRYAPQRVSPALFFIQHASTDGYDPTLCFGREPIHDIAAYSGRFNELLEQKINEIFSPDVPFTPTQDLRVCRTCPYALFCRR